jgi:Cu/Ag efflux protein CusF
MRSTAALAMILLFLVACCSKASPNAAKPVSEVGEKIYTLKGKILSRDASDNSLRVDHEAIPGLMEAMTMDYVVRGAKVAQLPPDQSKIEARLHVTEEKYWLTDVKKVP